MAMLHGCTLQDRAFVGLGAIVMDGCIIEGDAMLAAGAMLTPGQSVLPRPLWGGSPARYMRDLDDDAVTRMREGVEHYVHNARSAERRVGKEGFSSGRCGWVRIH